MIDRMNSPAYFSTNLLGLLCSARQIALLRLSLREIFPLRDLISNQNDIPIKIIFRYDKHKIELQLKMRAKFVDQSQSCFSHLTENILSEFFVGIFASDNLVGILYQNSCFGLSSLVRGGSRPDLNSRPKKYHFLFLLPFDAEDFKTCKNTIKLINLCAGAIFPQKVVL